MKDSYLSSVFSINPFIESFNGSLLMKVWTFTGRCTGQTRQLRTRIRSWENVIKWHDSVWTYPKSFGKMKFSDLAPHWFWTKVNLLLLMRHNQFLTLPAWSNMRQKKLPHIKYYLILKVLDRLQVAPSPDRIQNR